MTTSCNYYTSVTLHLCKILQFSLPSGFAQKYAEDGMPKYEVMSEGVLKPTLHGT